MQALQPKIKEMQERYKGINEKSMKNGRALQGRGCQSHGRLSAHAVAAAYILALYGLLNRYFH